MKKTSKFLSIFSIVKNLCTSVKIASMIKTVALRGPGLNLYNE